MSQIVQDGRGAAVGSDRRGACDGADLDRVHHRHGQGRARRRSSRRHRDVDRQAGPQTQVTEANGSYRFPALEVGTYEVSAELSGFTKASQPNCQISPGRELTIDLQMKVGGLAENVTVVGDYAGRGRQEQRDRDDDLAVAALQRADHPDRDQRDQLRARREQQLGVRWRRRLGQLAPDRRRRHARSERRHGLDLLQLQHGRGVPVPGPWRAGRIRRLHRRGGQHHHEVRRQPVLRAVRLLRHAARASAATTSPRRSPRRTPASPIRRPRRNTPTSRRSSAGRSSRTSCSSSSARSDSCSRPIRPAP